MSDLAKNGNARIQNMNRGQRLTPNGCARSTVRNRNRRLKPKRPQKGYVSQLLTPGSSLILSDYELSTETGDDTDFIVVMP